MGKGTRLWGCELCQTRPPEWLRNRAPSVLAHPSSQPGSVKHRGRTPSPLPALSSR